MSIPSIEIRNIPNDDLAGLAAHLNGLHVQTGFTDLSGRLVSGTFEGVKVLDNGKIALKVTRYMGGSRVLDSVTVPAGKDPLGRRWRTAVHVRSDSALYATLEA